MPSTAGASGYVLKRIGSDELVEAVRAVAAGESMLDSAVTGAVLQRLRETASDEDPGAFGELTDQERRVLAEVATGASNREIGGRLDLAEKTVSNYVSSVLAKLGLASRAEAAGYAIRHRLRELGPEAGGMRADRARHARRAGRARRPVLAACGLRPRRRVTRGLDLAEGDVRPPVRQAVAEPRRPHAGADAVARPARRTTTLARWRSASCQPSPPTAGGSRSPS